METFIGTILLFAGSYAPRDWAFCDGGTLQISQNCALYSTIGNKYGGDGRTTFALPALPPVKDTDGYGESKYIICLNGYYPTRD